MREVEYVNTRRGERINLPGPLVTIIRGKKENEGILLRVMLLTAVKALLLRIQNGEKIIFYAAPKSQNCEPITLFIPAEIKRQVKDVTKNRDVTMRAFYFTAVCKQFDYVPHCPVAQSN
jgi:hypothetical protein